MEQQPDTTEEAWPDWDDTFAEADTRILFPDLYRGRNVTRNNERYDVDTGNRNNPVIGIPDNGGIQWSEGNKLIDDAFPDYTPPESYDFEKEFAEWDPETTHKPYLRDESEADTGALSNARISDWVPATRKNLIGSNKQSSEFPPTPGRYPSLSSTGRSQLESSIHSSADEDGPVTKRKKINNKTKNANRRAKKKAGAGGEELADTSSVSQEDYNEDGPYPPTPGAPSDMDAEKDGDVTRDDAEPAEAFTGSLPTPAGQYGIVNIDTDVEMGEEIHMEPNATLGAERTERTDFVGVGNDPAEHAESVAEDFVMGENSVTATQNTEFDHAEHSKQTKSRDGKGVQSHHPIPPLFYGTPAHISDTSPIVEIPAPPASLLAAPTIEAIASSAKPTQKDQVNQGGTSNKTGKSSQVSVEKKSATQHKGAQGSAPSTPPGNQKHKQVSAASSPKVTSSPLKLLQKSAKMARRSSFTEAQAFNEDAPQVKTKGKVSGKTGILARADEDLLDDFVFMSAKDVDKMKVPELRNHIRAIESLRKWHNGVPKKHMADQYMIWQRSMQAMKAQKAEEAEAEEAEAEEAEAVEAAEPSQAGGLGSEEEEGEDIDAEGSVDEEYYEALESPVTGKVTPGPPLKSPFTDQPRSDIESPFVAKLTAGSPVLRRKAGRSRTPEMDEQNEPEVYKKFEAEEEMERKKRARRSISRPASYKV